MMPPFRTPGNASYFCSGLHSATTSPFFGKLRMCKPSGFAGPQPKHAFWGAYFSCNDCSDMVPVRLRLSILCAVCGYAGIAAQLWPSVKGARTDQSIVIVLLDDVRAPASHARGSKNRRVQFRRETEHGKYRRRVQIDIRTELFLALHRLLEL